MRQSKQARIDELERTLKIEQDGINNLQKAYEAQQQEFKLITDKFRVENRSLYERLTNQDRLITIIENLSKAKAANALPR